MTKSLQILAYCAATMATVVVSFPITSTTSTIRLTETGSTSLPHTVLFSAHKSGTRSAYSGTKVEDNSNGPPPGAAFQQQQAPPQQQSVFPPAIGFQRPDPYQQQMNQHQQQLQQQSQYQPAAYQPAAYNGNNNYQTAPAGSFQTAALPDQAFPAAAQNNGDTSYTANSKPWFEDPRGGFQQVAYAAPVMTQPTTATVDMTNTINQEYNPFVDAMAQAAPLPSMENTIGTRTQTNVPLPRQDFPVEVNMAPPLATIAPLGPFFPPAMLPREPPPLPEAFPGARKSDGILTNEPTKAFIQGNSRRTWSTADPTAQTSAVWLQAERPGGPLYANVKFRNGPSSTPQSMKVYSEDGYLRPLQAYFGRPRGTNRAISQTIDVMNTAGMEFPMSATISQSSDFGTHGNSFQGEMNWQKIQGKNGIRTFVQDANTEFVRVNLESDGLPLMCNIEVLQGPGDVRQVIELRSDDGSPWEGIVAVPGHGASVILRNVGPLEFPIRASVENHGYD